MRRKSERRDGLGVKDVREKGREVAEESLHLCDLV